MVAEHNAEYVAPPDLIQKWYRDRFGIHFHPDEWPLNMTKRAHEFCRKVWVEWEYNATYEEVNWDA